MSKGISELAKASKQSNWQRLQIKGAIANLRYVANSNLCELINPNQLLGILDKMEATLLKANTQLYQELKERINNPLPK